MTPTIGQVFAAAQACPPFPCRRQVPLCAAAEGPASASATTCYQPQISPCPSASWHNLAVTMEFCCLAPSYFSNACIAAPAVASRPLGQPAPGEVVSGCVAPLCQGTRAPQPPTSSNTNPGPQRLRSAPPLGDPLWGFSQVKPGRRQHHPGLHSKSISGNSTFAPSWVLPYVSLFPWLIVILGCRVSLIVIKL